MPKKGEQPTATNKHLEAALALGNDGWNVFPLRPGSKEPLIPKRQGGNGAHDGTQDSGQIREWWTRWPDAGIGANLGDDKIAFDIDYHHGGTRLKAFPETRVHLSGRDPDENDNRNCHLIYRFEPGSRASKLKSGTNVLGSGIDIRAGRGSYIVMPPTLHEETGKPYEIDAENAGEFHVLTDSEVEAMWDEGVPALLPKSRTGQAAPVASGGSQLARDPKTALAKLLAHPAEKGGRNDGWLVKVCGHLAREHRNNRAAYERAVSEANGLLAEPLGDAEVSKTAESIWNKEQAKPVPAALEDSPLAEWVAEQIGGRHRWAGGLGWLTFDGKVWRVSTEATITEAVRREFIRLNKEALDQGVESSQLRRLAGLLQASKIRAVVGLLKGIVEADAASFDSHPDLLNCNNGVVDLRTGKLLPHDPAYLMTKVTKVDYQPDARSADWEAALTALPPEVADWMQVRFGQGITGHMTPDDVLPILQGGGSNGKSTVVTSVMVALGDHAVSIPEKLLTASPGDHPTELTTLMGARLAVIEELPDGRMSIKRLKESVGTPTITARRIRQDNVTWSATHSIFLTSNYHPRIQEADYGTWRRLALVRFPYTYRRADKVRSGLDREENPGLRTRLQEGRQGQREAVLAWLVAGAQRWYQTDRVMPSRPQQVEDDTETWRSESDLIYSFITEQFEFDPFSHVLTAEVYAAFSDWLETHGLGPWADQTFVRQLAGHELAQQNGVTKEIARAEVTLRDGTTRPRQNSKSRVWRGLRWRSQNKQGELL
ncbi:phage/plasmid primase, P4 family [Arthrobacter pigmenti]